MKIHKLIYLPVFLLFFTSCNKNDNPAPQEFVFPSKVIKKIIVDPSGVKWFATDKGVISFDGTKWTTYSDDKNLSTGPISDLAFDLTTGIKNLLLASKVGYSIFGIETSKISFQNFNTQNSGILTDTVTSIGVDASNIKYLGTSKGLSILKSNKWDKYLGRYGDGEPLLKYKISSISAATNGYIFATTEGGGVSRFKYTDAISGATTYKLPWAWGLPSDTVFTVFVDGETQWYGTLRGAAFHSTELTKSDWVTYTRTEGLICDSVYAISKDLSGAIWFGTHDGVTKLTMGTKDTVWTNYTTKDGLIANKINTIAIDLEGKIWFGTDKGVSQFSNNKWTNY